MSLYRAKKDNKLSKPALILGYPVLITGALIDCITNLIICTCIFFEIPKELLVTKRLSRHIKTDKGYRYTVANWVCKNLLDQFDSNREGHCR